MPGLAPSAFAAMSATSCQVGLAGTLMPFSFITSLRYIRKEDSP